MTDKASSDQAMLSLTELQIICEPVLANWINLYMFTYLMLAFTFMIIEITDLDLDKLE